MPIINTSPITQLTLQQRLEERANLYQVQLNGQFHQLNLLATQISDFIYRNKEGLSPQQAFDLFGTNASDLIKISTGYALLVNEVVGIVPQVKPDNVNLISNPNGTVTVQLL